VEDAMLNDAMQGTAGFNLPLRNEVIGRYDNPTLFVNYYRCPSDGTCWADFWMGASHCECPACHRDVEAYWSVNA
jgi:hypothetical protein